MMSRIIAHYAQRLRNRLPLDASAELWTEAETVLRAAEPFDPGQRLDLRGAGGRQLRPSRLAIGTGSNGRLGGSNQTRQLGLGGLANLLLHGYHEHGINFWDSADQYGSHPHLAEALRRVDREQVVVLSKSVAETPAQMRRDIDRFRTELGTDYIDILLLHCVTHRDWPRRMKGVMEAVSEAQQAGIVRMKGVSCHTLAALQAAAREPWVELDLARINPRGKSMDATPDKVVPVLRQMKAAGKTVMGMKILGNGRLAGEMETCLRFALGLDCLDCMTVGFQSRSELDTLVARARGLQSSLRQSGQKP